jgi:hypothetical protein
MVWYGMVWYGMVWYGMVWVWYGMVWYGMVWYLGTTVVSIAAIVTITVPTTISGLLRLVGW